MGKKSVKHRADRAGAFPLQHCAHHYRGLMQQWSAFVKRAGLRWKRFATVDELPVYFVESIKPNADQEVIYLSAGLHGDEPAPPWALLEWAQDNVALLRARPFVIFPCLNPHGLINNTRVDQQGVDLNRSFNHPDHPLIAAWMRTMKDRRIALGLCLHEDYDAQGCYVYELAARQGRAKRMLEDVAKVLPIDGRKNIEGRRANAGVITRRTPPELPGHPEAIVLQLMGAPLTLTFETPSEFSLTDRIAAQKQFITAAIRHGLEP